MSEIQVRSMKIHDLDRVMAIEEECFSTPWSRSSFEKEIKKNPLARYVVLTVADAVAAYGGMWYIVDEAHVTNIAVGLGYRGQKLGEKLVEAMVHEAHQAGILKMTLEVRRSNLVAQGLYKKLGFLSCGVRPGYYDDNGEDALIMWKELY